MADDSEGDGEVVAEATADEDADEEPTREIQLIEDESGKTKFTVWSQSRQPIVEEGERVVLRNVAKSWYKGRVSVALTGRSSISFPEREAWWTE